MGTAWLREHFEYTHPNDLGGTVPAATDPEPSSPPRHSDPDPSASECRRPSWGHTDWTDWREWTDWRTWSDWRAWSDGWPGRRRRTHRRFHGPLRRSSDTRVLAGVCGGISEATGFDVTLVRIVIVLLCVGSGVGIAVYALAWLLLPLQGERSTIFTRAITDRRGIRLVIATIPLFVVVQVLADGLHMGYLGGISWPVFLAFGVAILIRRNASDGERVWINSDLMPMLRPGDRQYRRGTLLARLGTAVVLGIVGGLILVSGHTPSHVPWRPVAGVLLVIAAIVVVFGPWWLSLVRDLMSERQARARAEERAEMAAHIHDSVLQTLALIQRGADDPQQVVRLARAQERDLRSWLFEGRAPGGIGKEASTLAEGVDLIQGQVEADHGITVHVVMVGDCALDDGMRALLDASREATVNAAKWSDAQQVSIYCEVDGSSVMVYVRDRGRGFDPEAVPADRQGIASSICARMARFGGSAIIRSAPGEGAEVELSMPKRELVA